MDNRQMSTTPLEQATELLERSQQLLQVANAEAAVHAITAARVRRMPTAELRRDPVLWAAYTCGWDDRTAVFRRATNVNPTPAVTDRSRSPRRPAHPAGTPRPPTMPLSARLFQPPPQPLMAAPVPRPRTPTTATPPASRAPATTTPITTNQGTARAPPNARTRRNTARLQ
ncbi:mucin-2-like [Aphis craccivora]|uniref:Mucin-2-like n=1 Tax=Aphis craccivora TaxID=307492 RepID=A0A6G0W005_APHCR|nr:mucin-2-like [Aphis craccivora]